MKEKLFLCPVDNLMKRAI